MKVLNVIVDIIFASDVLMKLMNLPSVNRMKIGKKKNSGGDESLNQKFISTISKKCPNCSNNIEKNGGCNHMCCSNCHFHFCWLCMGKFGDGSLGGTNGYSTHRCNNYGKDDSSLSLDKDDWERFRWYSERYNGHTRSQALEEKLKGSGDIIRGNLQEVFSLTPAGSIFYSEAINQLLLSRNIMRGSYIFGFFRPSHCPEIHKELFEHRQNELERHTEMLSQLLGEEDPPLDKLMNDRTQIINTTRLLLSSSKALLDVALNAVVDNKTLKNLKPFTPYQLQKQADKQKKDDERKQKEKEELQKTLDLSKKAVKNDYDRQLLEAIALSKEEAADEELRLVMELSLRESSSPPSSTTKPPTTIPTKTPTTTTSPLPAMIPISRPQPQAKPKPTITPTNKPATTTTTTKPPASPKNNLPPHKSKFKPKKPILGLGGNNSKKQN